MACINKSDATLRIFGEELIPGEISKLLGCEPTRATQKGEIVVSSSGNYVRRSGSWLLSAPTHEPENINGQVEWLLKMVSDDLGIWQHLHKEFQVDLFCGLFMSSSNEGFGLSLATIVALANRGLEIGFDIYDSTE